VKLGDFLDQAAKGSARLAPTCPVAFKLVGVTKTGEPVVGEGAAELVFVADHERIAAIAAADKRLQAEFPAGTSADIRDLEVTYEVLQRSMRDADNLAAFFAPSVDALKRALVKPELERLAAAYWDFMRREFPEALTDEEKAALEDEAAKNS